ncbi:hypothetical protein TNCV_1640871 [Trichonephila clavipes]|nr:hypothetical protein TNCV_1640871 [Trichonephila clavipes]
MRQSNQQFSSILTKIGNGEQLDEMEIALIESPFCTVEEVEARCPQGASRREKCATISSDNAKDFAGANRELKRLHNLLKCPEEKLSSYLSSEGISWNFMPP